MALNVIKRDDLQLLNSTEWDLQPMNGLKNIYNLVVDGNPSDWILKVYSNVMFFRDEVRNLKQLEKAGIDFVPRILAHQEEPIPYIIMSKMKGCDLFDYIHGYGYGSDVEREHLPLDEAKHIFKKIVKCYELMLDKGIIHIDVKPENIIYDSESDNVSIVDFESRYTAIFKPPQVSKDVEKNIVWSLGITLKDMIFGSNDIDINSIADEDLRDLLLGMIDTNISSRMTVSMILDHPWFY